MRILAGVLAGALAVSVSPLLGLTTAGALEPATGDGSVCEDPPAAEPFTDVADDDSAQAEITCLFNTGITTGVTPTTYQPVAPVTRRQMALFLVRMADEIVEKGVPGQVTPLPAADGVTPFTDIADERADIRAAIDRLEAAGIAEGVTATTFVPEANVTRRQMAKFIVRLQEFMAGEDITPDDAPNAFTDDEGDSGEAELNTLAAEGVFVGNAAPNAGTVSPGANITRRQMAFVIVRKLQYLFEEGVIGRLFPENDTNQDFGVSPTGSTVAAFDGSDGAPVTVNFSGLDPAKDYDVATVPCSDYDGSSATSNGVNVLDENGVSDTSGQIAFSDQPTADDIADDLGSDMYGNADILTVGFTNVGGNYADDMSPDSAGALSVRVGTSGGSDCVYIVVFEDNADDDDLNLGGGASPVENNNFPTDPFAISGAITWTSGDAPTGTDLNDDCIVYLNKSANTFILGTGDQFTYGDAGDTYWYQGAEVDQAVTLAQFEEALSLGDCLYNSSSGGSAYSRTGANVFEIEHDYRVNTPSAPMVGTIGDLDGDADDDDVTFSWTDPNPGADIDEYQVTIYTTAGAFVGSQSTDEVNTVGGGDATMTLVYEDLADGTYVATVMSDSETDDGYFDEGPFSATFAVGAPADTAAPIILDATAVDTAGANGDNGIVGIVDDGDWQRFVFNEVMNTSVAADGSTYRLTDADGTVIDVVCGGDGGGLADGCFLNPTAGSDPETGFEFEAGQIMYVRIGAAGSTITPQAAGTTPGAQYPVTITNVNAAWDDVAGNQLNLAGSVDKTIENA